MPRSKSDKSERIAELTAEVRHMAAHIAEHIITAECGEAALNKALQRLTELATGLGLPAPCNVNAPAMYTYEFCPWRDRLSGQWCVYLPTGPSYWMNERGAKRHCYVTRISNQQGIPFSEALELVVRLEREEAAAKGWPSPGLPSKDDRLYDAVVS